MREGAHTAGDFSFIYRSSNEASMQFLSSIRFEALREGIEDFEKIRILKEDSRLIAELNSLLAQFHKNSGVNAESLIPEAHEAITNVFVVPSPVTGLAKENSRSTIRLYPNPFTNEIMVSGIIDPRFTVSVISPACGVVPILASGNGGNLVLSTNQLAKGFYVVEVSLSDGSQVVAELMLKE